MINLEFVRLQTVFFLSSLDFSSKLKLALTLTEILEDLFDTEPTILPVPDNFPQEIPRLVLKSKDKIWTYQVSFNRFELVFDLPPEKYGTGEFEDVLGIHAQTGLNIWESLQTDYKASGHRIGVVTGFASLGDNLVDVLRSRFVQPSSAPEPHELQLHALHKLPIDNLNINRWVRCFAGPARPDKFEANNLLRVEVDINSVPEETFDLTSDNIQRFFDQVKVEVLSTSASLFDDSPTKRIF
jgi:hypothetical protein